MKNEEKLREALDDLPSLLYSRQQPVPTVLNLLLKRDLNLLGKTDPEATLFNLT